MFEGYLKGKYYRDQWKGTPVIINKERRIKINLINSNMFHAYINFLSFIITLIKHLFEAFWFYTDNFNK